MKLPKQTQPAPQRSDQAKHAGQIRLSGSVDQCMVGCASLRNYDRANCETMCAATYRA
jgi:hypothetical protein